MYYTRVLLALSTPGAQPSFQTQTSSFISQEHMRPCPSSATSHLQLMTSNFNGWRHIINWWRHIINWWRHIINWWRHIIIWWRHIINWWRHIINWWRHIVSWWCHIVNWWRQVFNYKWRLAERDCDASLRDGGGGVDSSSSQRYPVLSTPANLDAWFRIA